MQENYSGCFFLNTVYLTDDVYRLSFSVDWWGPPGPAFLVVTARSVRLRTVPYRPDENTISAKMNNHIGHRNSYCYLASTFVNSQSKSESLRLETSYSLPSHISRDLKNSTIVDIFQSALTWVYISSVVWIWAIIYCKCLCSSPTVEQFGLRQLSAVARQTDSFRN